MLNKNNIRYIQGKPKYIEREGKKKKLGQAQRKLKQKGEERSQAR